jgi:hypothetical protein
MTKEAQNNERLASLEANMKTVVEGIARLEVKVDTMIDERVQIATLKEKVRTLEKLVWIALSTALAASVKAFFDIITKGR